MRILSIDAATKAMGVAVVEDDLVLARAELNIGKTHSERLLPLLDGILNTADISPESLDQIAVTVGPGSFTGLRIGISTAKALAYAWDKPLNPVLTLDALAYNLKGFDKIACPVLDARKNEVYYAVYDETGSRVEEPQAMAPGLLAEHLAASYAGRRIVLLGDGAKSYYPLFIEKEGLDIELMPPLGRYFLAASAGLLAAAQPEKAQNPALVKAFYLRLSEAEARRKAAQDAGA
jgi:tRNA threonylcarbamoyladenosine biosynthesis protein TsaB